MHRELVRFGLGAGMLVGLGLSGAQAAAIRPLSPKALGLGSTFAPVAMCGFRCEYGGRHIPGPPSVCYERGLNFCGLSRGWGGPYGERGPDRGEGYGGGYGGRGPYDGRYEGNGRRQPEPYEGGGRYGGGRGDPDDEQ
jgi:hypothetical protein